LCLYGSADRYKYLCEDRWRQCDDCSSAKKKDMVWYLCLVSRRYLFCWHQTDTTSIT